MKRASSPSASHSASLAIAASHLRLGVIAEHVRGDEVLPPWSRMADANAHPAELGPEHRVDRAQAVMARETAADSYLDLEWREVELVVEDGEGVEIELVELQCLLNGIAAVVHEGLGLQQQDALPAHATLGDEAAELLRPGPKGVRLGDEVRGHEADIVPVQRILRARIAETDPDLHRRDLA